jgi:hypothetical protein
MIWVYSDKYCADKYRFSANILDFNDTNIDISLCKSTFSLCDASFSIQFTGKHQRET